MRATIATALVTLFAAGTAFAQDVHTAKTAPTQVAQTSGGASTGAGQATGGAGAGLSNGTLVAIGAGAAVVVAATRSDGSTTHH